MIGRKKTKNKRYMQRRGKEGVCVPADNPHFPIITHKNTCNKSLDSSSENKFSTSITKATHCRIPMLGNWDGDGVEDKDE